MKIVVDMNLSPDWASILQESGFDAVHWSTVGPQDSADEDIVAYADEMDAVVLTRDLDFGSHLAMSGRRSPSVVQLRSRQGGPSRHGSLVVKILREARAALTEGALVTVDLERVRVRSLPFPPVPSRDEG